MNTKDRLQIILITFNRSGHLQNTLNQILEESSAIKDYDILVLDNNSTDNTHEVVSSWQQKFPNLRYQKNKYNLGISGNIAKAMLIAEKDYVWMLCDDDVFDFSNWNEVEQAIANDEKLIFVSTYALGTCRKEDMLAQATFLPAMIYKTSVFTDSMMRNVVDNIYTLMPHLCPLIDFINKNKKIYIVKQAIVTRHDDGKTDCAYTRGYSNTSNLFPKSRFMMWGLGYANILDGLEDKKLVQSCMMHACPAIHHGMENFIPYICELFRGYPNYLADIFFKLDFKSQCQCITYYIKKAITGLDIHGLQRVLQFYKITKF